MALRLKNQWFNNGRPKSAKETASVLAFIIWRVTQNMVKQMREAEFDIEVGPQFFAFMREMLGFLIQVVDRMAFERMSAEERAEFTAALARRVAEILEESEREWMGDPPAGADSWRNQFIDFSNELGEAYADFGHGPEGPDFSFVRYLGSRIEAVMPPKDQYWVKDHLMGFEVPVALEMVRRGMHGALSTEAQPPKGRASMSGD